MNINLPDITAVQVVIEMRTIMVHSRYSDPNRLRPNMVGYGQTYVYGNY